MTARSALFNYCKVICHVIYSAGINRLDYRDVTVVLAGSGLAESGTFYTYCCHVAISGERVLASCHTVIIC